MSEVVLETESKLPNVWIQTTMGDLSSKIHYGYTSKSSKEGIGSKYLRITDIQNNSVNWDNVPYCQIPPEKLPYFLLKSNDLVFARTGATVGKSFLIKDPQNSIFASYLIRIVLSEKLSANYIDYFFKSDLYWKQISSGSVGMAQPNFNATKLSKIKIPLPPINEQKRIVEKMESIFLELDHAKSTLEKINMQLNQYKESLLKSVFEGKFTEKWRQKNEPILQKEEIELWKNQRQTQYDVGCKLSTNQNKPKLPEFKIIDDKNIPQSWISMTIESIASFVIDCPHSTPKFVENGECCIDTTCIEQSKIRWDDIRKVTSKQFQERITRMPILENDIIFSREGTVGTAVMVPKDAKLCLGQRVMMFRFPDFLNPKFCELFLQSSNFKQQYLPLIGGSVAQHLNVGDIRKLKILIPTIKEQKEIISKLEIVLSLIKNTENITTSILCRLDSLRSTVLKQAFEGKLVLQDPNDEPAEILLQKIIQEKEQLIQKQKISRSTKNVK